MRERECDSVRFGVCVICVMLTWEKRISYKEDWVITCVVDSLTDNVHGKN